MKALLLAAALAQAPAQPPSAFEPLEAEVKRAMTLSMPAKKGDRPAEKPYYANAALTEQQQATASASFGALVNRGASRSVSLSGRLRVGSTTFDNTNFRSYGFDGRRSGVPAEPMSEVLRQALWLRFDAAYKAALEDIARKRAYLETNQVAEQLPDFGPAKTQSLVLPPATLSVGLDDWSETVRAVSAAFLPNKDVHEGTATFRATADTQSMVTSEGDKHRFGANRAQVTLMASATAADGTEVRLQRRFTGVVAEELPSKEALVASAKAMSAEVAALAKSPAAEEDYTGPVLFTGPAAAMFFLQTIGDPLIAPRDELGSRPSGRLTSKLGKHIASSLLDVRDDPTLAQVMVGGKPVKLWGHYPIDDESVAPQPISLVEAGVLKTYFMSRTPTAKVKGSNGHCRGEHGAPGVMIVEGRVKTPLAAMKKRLVELAKEEDSDFGLMVELVDESVGRAWGNEGQRLSAPMVVTKVYADGREVPMRGLVFKNSSQRVLRDVIAVGEEPQVLNLEHHGQPTSVVAPPVLVRLLEMSRVQSDSEKPPALARP